MVDIATANGPRYRISAATIGAIASTVSVVLFVCGFITGALTLETKVSSLQTALTAIQARQDAQLEVITKSREEMAERLTKLEAKADYTTQGIADLKALRSGTGR